LITLVVLGILSGLLVGSLGKEKGWKWIPVPLISGLAYSLLVRLKPELFIGFLVGMVASEELNWMRTLMILLVGIFSFLSEIKIDILLLILFSVFSALDHKLRFGFFSIFASALLPKIGLDSLISFLSFNLAYWPMNSIPMNRKRKKKEEKEPSLAVVS